jgi:AmmeMemoRadiSam system protein B
MGKEGQIVKEALPALRTDIQLIQAEADGQAVIAVKDSLALLEGLVVLQPEAAVVLPFFDGQHSQADLQAVLTRANGGALVPLEAIDGIVNQLDELLLLQTDRYHARLSALRAEWNGLTVRPAAHAGEAYPEEPSELAAFLDQILDQAPDAAPAPEQLRALVAPHIDPRVGQTGYAHAYAPLKAMAAPRRAIVLGTGHMLTTPYSISDKTYQTPLGTCASDPEAVAFLRQAAGEGAQDDFSHRDEHSVEFQVLFLQHLFGNDLPIVPVLCGSLHEHLATVQEPGHVPAVAAFAKALSTLAEDGSLIVCGVDFSHVGPKFGHEGPAGDYELKFRAHDQKLIEAICAGSVEALWAESRSIADRWHVCGLPALAALLTALPDLRGQPRLHDVWHEVPTRSAVSYAAILLADRASQ